MKKQLLFFTIFTFFHIDQITCSNQITAIFFDIETIFHTDYMRASSYVGKIDSLRYLTHVGHLPSQQDLFEQLKNVPAKSKNLTYNNKLEMPLIFSDWLATLQPASKIKETISQYFSHKNISDIEKKVLFAIVNMMMTAQHLADTQKVSSKIEKLLEQLKKLGIKIFLVGNWAHINSLKSEFEYLFTLFDDVFVSGDLHLIKPYQQYYQTVLNLSGVSILQSLWIETEPKFIDKAQKYGLRVIPYDYNDFETFVKALKNHGLFF